MAALLLALGAFVYLRVEDALRSSVDQALRAQSAESIGHDDDGSLLDSDARESGTIAQVVDPDGHGRALRPCDVAGPPRPVCRRRSTSRHRS